MAFNQVTLGHTTTVGTFVIVSLPGTTKEDFVNTLRHALSAATPTSSDRVTNPVSQELLTDETQADVNICLWSLKFVGIHAPDDVRTKCQAIYEGVRDTLEGVGTRVSFRLETLEGAWEVD
jgi:hypothetical protein